MRRFDKPWIVEIADSYTIMTVGDREERRPYDWRFNAGFDTRKDANNHAYITAFDHEFVRVRYMGDSVDA